MKNPLKNKALHLPGQSLDDKLRDYMTEFFIQYLMIIVVMFILIASEWIHFYFPTKSDPMFITILGAAIIIFSIYKIKNKIPEVLNVRQGRDGERVVGQQLEQLRSTGCLIFHDVIGPDFNIDHVVISSQGIYTIETKTWSKKNSKSEIKFDGHNLIVNGHPTNDPMIQSESEAKWLKNLLKESTGKEFKVQPVIVFPGWFIDPVSSKLAISKGLWLLNPQALPTFIKNSNVTLNNEDQNLVAFHLTRYIYTTL